MKGIKESGPFAVKGYLIALVLLDVLDVLQQPLVWRCARWTSPRAMAS
jgi:hypothetical protein